MTKAEVLKLAETKLAKCKGSSLFSNICSDCIRYKDSHNVSYFEGINNHCNHYICNQDTKTMRKAMRI